MATIFQSLSTRESIPTGELPASPDDIDLDLDRVVTDPAYRQAVQDLQRRWGVRDRRKSEANQSPHL